MLRSAICAVLLLVCTACQTIETPRAVIADPPADPAHPAKSHVLYIPSHGVEISGLVYAPSGAGPHATALILHGWPGNEKNLDLARAVQRAGWNAVTINYRGSWGSPGDWSFAGCHEDVAATLAWLRSSAAAGIGIDSSRIVVIGHSLGGWLAARAAAEDGNLLGVALFSASDMGAAGRRGRADRAWLLDNARKNRQTLAATPEAAVDELVAHADQWGFDKMVGGLTTVPMLVLSANDGFAAYTDPLVAAVRSAGGRVESHHEPTDHVWSGKRVALQSYVVDWLERLPRGK